MRGRNAIEVCYEGLPESYKRIGGELQGTGSAEDPHYPGNACYVLGIIDNGCGRPTMKPCTKSMPMPVTVSSAH